MGYKEVKGPPFHLWQSFVWCSLEHTADSGLGQWATAPQNRYGTDQQIAAAYVASSAYPPRCKKGTCHVPQFATLGEETQKCLKR
jgi:hypothetical protein